MPRLWTCALFLLPLCSISAQDLPAKSGEVSLPLADFQSIWTELAEAKRAPLPEVAPFAPVGAQRPFPGHTLCMARSPSASKA